jgi:hypothetical protein
MYYKKLGRGGKDRSPGIILRIDRNNSPGQGNPRTGHRNPRADEAQRGDFFNQA